MRIFAASPHEMLDPSVIAVLFLYERVKMFCNWMINFDLVQVVVRLSFNGNKLSEERKKASPNCSVVPRRGRTLIL